GYVLYRRPLDSLFQVDEPLLTSAIVPGTEYVDTLYKSLADTAHVVYFYRIKAIDSSRTLSEPATFPAVSVTPSPAPIRLEFTAPDFSGREGDSATVTVHRLGNPARAVTVRWALSDSAAPAGTPSGTLA